MVGVELTGGLPPCHFEHREKAQGMVAGDSSLRSE